MLIYSVFTRPDASAEFWLESSVYKKIIDDLGFHLKESVPHLVLDTKVEISEDGLTYTQIKKFADNDAYINYRKIWLNVFNNIRPARQKYLDENNHVLEMHWKHDDLSFGGEIINGIPQNV